jgi:hypothetical protein
MPTSRSHLAAVAGPDGLVYAIGGRPDESTQQGTTQAVEAYDPLRNTWSPVDRLIRGRSFFGAANGSDGRLYAIGGDFDLQLLRSTVEAFAPGPTPPL